MKQKTDFFGSWNSDFICSLNEKDFNRKLVVINREFITKQEHTVQSISTKSVYTGSYFQTLT